MTTAAHDAALNLGNMLADERGRELLIESGVTRETLVVPALDGETCRAVFGRVRDRARDLAVVVFKPHQVGVLLVTHGGHTSSGEPAESLPDRSVSPRAHIGMLTDEVIQAGPACYQFYEASGFQDAQITGSARSLVSSSL